jgi:hypothetical protein
VVGTVGAVPRSRPVGGFRSVNLLYDLGWSAMTASRRRQAFPCLAVELSTCRRVFADVAGRGEWGSLFAKVNGHG